jgi:malic enzyme
LWQLTVQEVVAPGQSREVSRSIALAVAARAVQDGLAGQHRAEELERLVDAKMWLPKYLPMKRKRES